MYSLLMLHNCTPVQRRDPNLFPYKFTIGNGSKAATALVFDAFGNRVSDYFSLPQNTYDTILYFGIKSRSVPLVMYQISLEEVAIAGGSGIEAGEFRSPVDISPSHSFSSSFGRFYIADPDNNRIAVLTSRFLHAQPLVIPGVERPSCVREIDQGVFIVYSQLDRSVSIFVNRTGVEKSASLYDGKALGGNVRVEIADGRNILICDPQNGRVLLVNRKLETLSRLESVSGMPLSAPMHAIISLNRLYVLEKSRKSILCMSRGGSLISETVHEELSRGIFILPTEWGIILFTENKALLFNTRMELLCLLPLSRIFDAGHITSGGRIILVSRADKTVCEYRCVFDKQGERWGTRLTD